MVQRLHAALLATGCPLAAVRVIEIGTGSFDPAPGASLAQIALATNALQAFDWRQAAHDAWLLGKAQAQAKARLNTGDRDDLAMAVRAIADIVRIEFNRHTQVTNGLIGAIQAATSLADLKARTTPMVGILQEYTAQQLTTAIQNRINTEN